MVELRANRNYARIGARSVLSDEEIQEQEDEAKMWKEKIREEEDEAKMWTEKICACNVTYTSNECCFSLDGLVWEDSSLNKGPVGDL